VEWGSGRGPVEPRIGGQDPEPDEPQTRRISARISGRWTAVTLAAAGVAAMMASELLPWTTLHMSTQGNNPDSNPLGPTRTLSLGLDRLQTFEVFGYEFAMLATLAVLGALLFGSVRQRRAVFGVGVGLLAAQALHARGARARCRLVGRYANARKSGRLVKRLQDAGERNRAAVRVGDDSLVLERAVAVHLRHDERDARLEAIRGRLVDRDRAAGDRVRHELPRRARPDREEEDVDVAA